MPFRFMVVCAAMSLTGCLAMMPLPARLHDSVPMQPFNKAASSHVRRIGIVTANSPHLYRVDLLSRENIFRHPNNGLPYGALTTQTNDSPRSAEFTALQGEYPRQLGPALTQAISQALTATGAFEVVQVPPYAPEQPRTAFLKYYPGAECDAYLDVAIAYAGYAAADIANPFKPTFYVPVRLVDARTKEVLYSSAFFMSDGQVPDDMKFVPPDKHYAFQNYDTLKSDAARAGEGLKKGVSTLASFIAKDLQ